MNADQIFRDLGLPSYQINWDGNGDGIVDKTNETNFIFEYDKAEVYYPSFSLPGLGNNISFSFPLRVEKSLTPVCTFEFQQKQANDYQVAVKFFDGGDRFIENYNYLIYDASTNTHLDTINGEDVGMDFSHRFPGNGSYLLKMNFITKEGQEGNCQGEVKITDKASYNVNYDLFLSTPSKPTFKKIETKLTENAKVIALNEVPSKLKLKIQKIDPLSYDTKIAVALDGKSIVESKDQEYLFDIKDSKAHTLSITIEDKVRGLFYQEELTAQIGLEDIVGDLKVIGETIGFSPLTVTLDASATKLNNPQDEITYFSRELGDGTIKNNLSNAVLKHTYHYNNTTNNGIFKPKVSVYTKLGRSLTFALDEPIIVKKQLIQLTINSISHPTQEARVGDVVSF